MRVLVGAVDTGFEDVLTRPDDQQRLILDPDSHVASQRFALDLRAAASNGFVYPSVRRPDGECIVAFHSFHSKVDDIPVQEQHLQYRWNGNRMDKYFDSTANAGAPTDTMHLSGTWQHSLPSTKYGNSR